VALRKAPHGPSREAPRPDIRVVRTGDRPIGAAVRRRGRKPWDSFFARVLGGSLLVSLPVVALLGLLTFQEGLQTSTDAATARSQATAEATAIRIGAWLGERKSELRHFAQEAQGPNGQPLIRALVERPAGADPAFEAIEIVSTSGKVLGATAADPELRDAAVVTLTNSLTLESMQPIRRGADGLVWIMTEPIVGRDGKTQGVVAGDLNVAALKTLLDPYGRTAGSPDQEVHVANGAHVVIYSTDWGTVTSDAAMVTKGALTIQADTSVVDRALDGGPGWARMTDFRGRDVLAGFSPIASLGWAVIASTDTAEALAPVYAQARWTLLAETIGALLMIAFAIVLSRFTIRPIVALSRAASKVEAGDLTVRVGLRGGGREVRHLNVAFNAMVERLGDVLFRLRGEVTESATRLSTVAEQLASATFEQTTAATATSASMEELSRSSAAVAETIGDVAAQASEARNNLELAQTDLKASGDRTLALAGRVNEIEGILELIDDIADQTNLLALNAAIEAARAGDSGRGFAVVADEVRRLAERSKAAAAQIARLVEGAQAQSSETVMALEKSVQQLDRGLSMMQTMTKAGDQVLLASQQQRSSTEQVVLAIENIAESSRSVAATAQEIAAAAARQGELAAELAGSGWEDSGK